MKERYWRNLYTTMAPYYDQFNSKVDYEGRANFIRWLIKKYKKTDGKTMLEVACGTGNYTKIFKKDFKVIGVDASRDMLKIAKNKVKGVKFLEGKFGKINLKMKFDIIICKGSMDYNYSYAELSRTLSNFYKQLKPGGVAIFGFERARESFNGGVNSRTALDGKKKVVEMSVSREHQGKDYFDLLAFYVLWDGKRFSTYRDEDKQALFSTDRVMKIMRKIGFKPYLYWDSGKKDPDYGSGKKPDFVGVKE